MIRNKKLRAAAAFLALVILALALMPAGPALAVSQSEIDALEEQRDELKAQGIVLLDTPQGVQWKREN